jgi:SAM-dependent methyltransferase
MTYDTLPQVTGAESSGGVYRWVQSARVFRAVQSLVGSRGLMREVVPAYVQPRPGERILDLGCGPGELMDFLPDVEYLGLDRNAGYVAAAQRRFAGRGRFMRFDVEDLDERCGRRFDAIIAAGLIHHLPDSAAARLFSASSRLLDDGGRLVTIDGVRVAGQPAAARALLRIDRGRAVRSVEGYRRLASEAFGAIETHVRHDLLRIPASHLVMICRGGGSMMNR